MTNAANSSSTLSRHANSISMMNIGTLQSGARRSQNFWSGDYSGESSPRMYRCQAKNRLRRVRRGSNMLEQAGIQPSRHVLEPVTCDGCLCYEDLGQGELSPFGCKRACGSQRVREIPRSDGILVMNAEKGSCGLR